MQELVRKFLVLTPVLLLIAVTAPAQTAGSPSSDRGFTEVETFQGELNSLEKTLKLDSNLGYDFNRHFGVFTGLPVYFTNVSAGTTTTGTATSSQTVSGIGNLYLGFALRAPNPALNYAMAVTAGAPTGDTKKGLSTGRATIDWLNHFDKSFNRLTPFFDAGLGNSVPDSRLLTRPFTSLGAIGHLEEGAEFELAHHFSIGSSAYQIVPFGNQKIFSKISNSGSGNANPNSGGKGNHGVFQGTPVASGSGLTRENGVNTWVAFEPPARLWRAEIGFSRSMTFDLNNFTFNLGFNIGKMLRSRSGA